MYYSFQIFKKTQICKYHRTILERARQLNEEQPEYLQAVEEVLTLIEPVKIHILNFKNLAILERMVEPERCIFFIVSWVNDGGESCCKLRI